MFQVTFGLTVLTIIIGVILIKMIRVCKEPSQKFIDLESRFTKLESKILILESLYLRRLSQNPNYQQDQQPQHSQSPPNYQEPKEPPNYPY